ncbi:ATP-binding protein [Flavobacterium sp.]|uniref:ATP-binding protein n=1 Tax=Flavobacterium sp. TaxID=239 RepID=UPI003D0BDA1D
MMHKKAEIFENINDPENALKTLFEYGKIAEEHNLSNNLAHFYLKVANINSTNLNFTTAKKFLYKAKKTVATLKSDTLQAACFQAFFRYHSYVQSDSAKYYLDKTELATKKSKKITDLAKFYINSYNYFDNQSNAEKAKIYIEKALNLTSKLEDSKIKNHIIVNYGYFLLMQKKYVESIKLYRNFLKSLKEGHDVTNKSDALINLAYGYEMIGDYKSALFYTNQYIESQETILTGKNKKLNENLENQFDLALTEAKYKKAHLAILEQQRKSERVFYLLATLVILTGGISYFFYQNLKLKQSYKMTSFQNDLQNHIISATIDGQEKERSRISEVLHDSVSATLSSVGLHLSAFETSLNENQRKELLKTRALLKQAHDTVRDLSHDLIPPLLVKFGLQMALKDLCENHSNTLIDFRFMSQLPSNRKYHHELEVKFFYIVSELLNNIIKHADAHNVILKLTEQNSKLKINIQDDGKGFNVKENITGFGITQIKARIDSMNGTFKIISAEGEGTLIRITIPIID